MECVITIPVSCLIPVIYVSSVYLFDLSGTDRNDPVSITRRTYGVLTACALSLFVTIFILSDTESQTPVWSFLGFRTAGFFAALTVPLVLTAILFMGSISLMIADGSFWQFFHYNYWRRSVNDPMWFRNIVTAPVTEELAFRACSASLLLHCYNWQFVTFIVPLSFALCHYHHIFDHMKRGNTFITAFLQSSFQAVYTFLFGVYATFLFIRTGHLIAPMICHSFCNLMGFPPFDEILEHRNPLIRMILCISFIIGLFLWCLLLFPLTSPAIYANRNNSLLLL